VNAGATRQDGRDGTFHRVSNIFVHPNYREDGLVSDIAIVRTIFPFNFNTRIRPISLGSSIFVGSNERVTVSGWGFTETNGPTSDALQTLQMTTMSNNLCSSQVQNTPTRGWITNEKLCTVGSTLDSGICAGEALL
jgi:hypothetical protein